jgi:hypothetical protein
MTTVFGPAVALAHIAGNVSRLEALGILVATAPSLRHRVAAWCELADTVPVKTLAAAGVLPVVAALSRELLCTLRGALQRLGSRPALTAAWNAAAVASARILSWQPDGLADSDVAGWLTIAAAACPPDSGHDGGGSGDSSGRCAAAAQLCVAVLSSSRRCHDRCTSAADAVPCLPEAFGGVTALLRHGLGVPALALNEDVQLQALHWLFERLGSGSVAPECATAALPDLRAGVLRHLAHHPDEWAAPGSGARPSRWGAAVAAARLASAAGTAAGAHAWWWTPMPPSLPVRPLAGGPSPAAATPLPVAPSDADPVRFLALMLRLAATRVQQLAEDLVGRFVGTAWVPLDGDPSSPSFLAALQAHADAAAGLHSGTVALLSLFRDGLEALLQRCAPDDVGGDAPDIAAMSALPGCRNTVRELATALVTACAEVQTSPLWGHIADLARAAQTCASPAMMAHAAFVGVDRLRAAMMLPSLHAWLDATLAIVADDAAALGDEGLWPTLVHVALPLCHKGTPPALEAAGLAPASSATESSWFRPACDAFLRSCLSSEQPAPAAVLLEPPVLPCLLSPLAMALLAHDGALLDPESVSARTFAPDVARAGAAWFKASARAIALAAADATATIAAAGTGASGLCERLTHATLRLCQCVDAAEVAPIAVVLSRLDPRPTAGATAAAASGMSHWRQHAAELLACLRAASSTTDRVQAALDACVSKSEAGGRTPARPVETADAERAAAALSRWAAACTDAVAALTRSV